MRKNVLIFRQNLFAFIPLRNFSISSHIILEISTLLLHILIAKNILENCVTKFDLNKLLN